MTSAQARKKIWEINIDNGIDFMLGGFGHRAVEKEAAMHAMEKALKDQGLSETEVAAKMKAAFPTFWSKAGQRMVGSAGKAANAGGRAGQGLMGWGGRRFESFVAKAPGRIGRGIEFGSAAVIDARKTAFGLGKIGQLLLTGKGPRTSFGEAFFPFFKTHAANDLAKYALNPAIGRRLVYAAAPIAIFAGLREALHPAAPPPSVYFDGRYMRHVNDMGASADYGQKMMGSNSTLNESARATMLMQLSHIL